MAGGEEGEARERGWKRDGGGGEGGGGGGRTRTRVVAFNSTGDNPRFVLLFTLTFCLTAPLLPQRPWRFRTLRSR